MGKKHSLPESLELLLDTMCNTFGGIMFIAISLIVISQLVAKTQQTMTPEEINEANMVRMERNIEALQQELLMLRKQELEAGSQVEDASPERREVIRELIAVREKNLQIQNDIERMEIKSEAERERVKRLKSEAERTDQELAAKRRELRETQRKIADKKQKLETQIAQLEETLGNLQPRKLRFSREVETSLKPYWVLLKENRLYRLGGTGNPRTDEVGLQRHGNRVRMIPRKGTMLGESPEAELDFLFRGIDKGACFISLVVDYHSFAALLATKQYLRNRGGLVSWSVNPEFEFIYSDHVSYRASE